MLINRKEYKKIVKEWNRFNSIQEAFNLVKKPDHVDEDDWKFDFGYEDETEDNYNQVSSKSKEFYNEFDPIKDKAKIEKFNSNNATYGVNSKIFSIINKLENYVQQERELKNDNSIVGKILLYEDEYEGFVKFDFSNFTSAWPNSNSPVSSTIDFESTDKDWSPGYGKGAYRHMLTHKSTIGVSSVLFEIMLEFVSVVREKGICSDRYSSTVEAQKKWQIYANRSDVETEQLDINKDDSEKHKLPQLTPDDPTDDAAQGLAIKHKGNEWYNSIFSKIIKKKDMNTIKYICNHSNHLDLIISITNESQFTSKI
jgi:hypothetical protein